jgi:hypothetical protein
MRHGRKIPIAGGVILLLSLFAATPLRAGAGEPAPEEKILSTLPLEDLSPQERERILLSIGKLVRIHQAGGDPASGEVEAYLEGVELLARFLKRETVEERRRLLQEAADALRLVDRAWLDQAFHHATENDAVLGVATRARLEEQATRLRRVGDLLKEEQAISARQKAWEDAAERRYRTILRLRREGHHTLETIDLEVVRGAIAWMVEEIDRTFEEQVRPAHDRQVRLLSLFERLDRNVGTAARNELLRLFREYSSKMRALQRLADKESGESR